MLQFILWTPQGGAVTGQLQEVACTAPLCVRQGFHRIFTGDNMQMKGSDFISNATQSSIMILKATTIKYDTCQKLLNYNNLSFCNQLLCSSTRSSSCRVQGSFILIMSRISPLLSQLAVRDVRDRTLLASRQRGAPAAAESSLRSVLVTGVVNTVSMTSEPDGDVTTLPAISQTLSCCQGN